MLTLNDVAIAFPEITELVPLTAPSGQKDVLTGRAGGRRVVLKLVHPPADPKRAGTVMERTQREIDAVQKLQMDNVPTIFDSGTRPVAGVDRLFIVEQRIDGQTLQEVLRARGRTTQDELVSFLDVMLRAAVQFERAGLVHRDIKPANLMVDTSGKLWILDFGLVRFLDMESITGTFELVGPCTAGYGAPEQVRNLKPSIDSRADLFSIGVVSYEMTTGSNPYLSGKTHILQILQAVLHEDLPPFPANTGLSTDLMDFILVLSARFPSRRPQTAAQALEWFTPMRAPPAPKTLI